MLIGADCSVTLWHEKLEKRAAFELSVAVALDDGRRSINTLLKDHVVGGTGYTEIGFQVRERCESVGSDGHRHIPKEEPGTAANVRRPPKKEEIMR